MKLFNLVVILQIISLIAATKRSNVTVIEQSINYLAKYNVMNLGSIATVWNPYSSPSDQLLFENLWEISTVNRRMVNFLSIWDDNKAVQNVVSNCNSAVFVLFDIGMSKDILQRLVDIQRNFFVDNSFLLILSSYHD